MRKQSKAFTLIEIMIVVAIIAILVGVAVPAVMRSRMLANDALTKQALRSISAASEWYLTSNSSYPPSETSLLGAAPPYINSAYCGLTFNGYVYNCTFSVSSYTVSAVPVTVGTSGTTTYTVSTGGVLTP